MLPAPPSADYCKNSTKTEPIYYNLSPGLGYILIKVTKCSYIKVEQDTCDEASMIAPRPTGRVSCSMYSERSVYLTDNYDHTRRPPWWEIFTEVDVIVPALLVIFLFVVLVIGIVWYCYRHNDRYISFCVNGKLSGNMWENGRS